MLKVKSEIMRRRQRRHMSLASDADRRRHILDLFLLLLLLLFANVVALMWHEKLPLADAAWLTLTTVTTVGFGDLSPTTAGGKIATVLLIYVFGIFLLAQIVGEWIDYRLERSDRMRRGLWRWNMKDHILILNTPENHGARYLRTLIEQIRDTPGFEDTPIQVLSPDFPDGLPPDVSSLGVVLKAGKPEGRLDLTECGVEQASYVILLAIDTNDVRSDSLNLDLLDQLSDLSLGGRVVVECVMESNRERFRQRGANSVLRPVRAYPELIVRAMSSPGAEGILEDLFVYAGNHPERYDVSFSSKKWGLLASTLLLKGLGTPLGYLDKNDNLVTNPSPNTLVTGKALYLMVDQDANIDLRSIEECISTIE